MISRFPYLYGEHYPSAKINVTLKTLELRVLLIKRNISTRLTVPISYVKFSLKYYLIQITQLIQRAIIIGNKI